MKPFTVRVIDIIKSIPTGKVMCYGQIAAEAGNPRRARQVARLLHSMSTKYSLPWHRVINSSGAISLKGEGYSRQRHLLEKEGICFEEDGTIDLELYLYYP